MHYADAALVTASASHINGEYTSATLSLQGGATLTQKVVHYRTSRTGSTRLLVDTDGIFWCTSEKYRRYYCTNAFVKLYCLISMIITAAVPVSTLIRCQITLEALRLNSTINPNRRCNRLPPLWCGFRTKKPWLSFAYKTELIHHLVPVSQPRKGVSLVLSMMVGMSIDGD